MRKTLSLVAGVLLGAMIGCTGSSDAGGTNPDIDLLKTQVAALQTSVTTLQGTTGTQATTIAALEVDVTALEAAVASIERAALGAQVYAVAVGPSAPKRSRLSFKALAPTDPAIGTYMGHNATKLAAATTMQLTSPKGFYFEVPTDAGSVGPAPTFLGDVLYESFDCTGPAFLKQGNAISPYGARQGVVTRIGSDVAAAASYAMVVPGTAQTLVSFNSFKSSPSGCVTTPGAQFGFAIVSNDPNISGVSSGSLASDITVGPGG